MTEIKTAVNAMDGNLKTVMKASSHTDIIQMQAKVERWEKATSQG